VARDGGGLGRMALSRLVKVVNNNKEFRQVSLSGPKLVWQICP
jgi:hypothetical protein